MQNIQMGYPEAESTIAADNGDCLGCVLVIDDEPSVRRAIARELRAIGYRALEAGSARHALSVMDAEVVDAVMTDLSMPDMNGMDLMQALQTRGSSVPVMLTTGLPTIDSAARAIELGAFRYLIKPIPRDALRAAVDAAVKRSSSARSSEASAAMLERRFLRALAGLHIHLQPIVCTETHRTIGFEALMRSAESTLPGPIAVLEAAEKLRAIHVLGRRVRGLIARVIDTAPSDVRFFVNLHPSDLSDPELYDPDAPLSRHAGRVVLEITERASLESVPDIRERLGALRAMHYRIAIDDLGAGYAALSYFASIQPDLIKIDMSLISGIDGDPIRQRIVVAMVALADALGMEVVAEGVETREERDVITTLGCHFAQGYAIGRPDVPFPEGRWT